MEQWNANRYPSSGIGSSNRASYFTRYGSAENSQSNLPGPSRLQQTNSDTSGGGDQGSRNFNQLPPYVPFMRQYLPNNRTSERFEYLFTVNCFSCIFVEDPSRNYTTYTNGVKAFNGQPPNGGHPKVDDVNGPHEFAKQSSLNFPTSQPAPDIGYGDTNNGTAQHQQMYMVTPASQFHYAPPFYAKPVFMNHLPENPVAPELLMRAPKNPFWQQEPAFINRKHDEAINPERTQEFEKLLKQVLKSFAFIET